MANKKAIDFPVKTAAELSGLHAMIFNASDGEFYGTDVSNLGSGFINVKAFGAKGDGTTDDTNAFEQAIIAARGRLIAPRGKYNLSRTIVSNPDYPIIIQGEGYNVYNNIVLGGTVLNFTANVTGFACVNPNNTVEASHYIELRDLAMFGNNIASYGVQLEYAHNVHISNVWISGFLNDAIEAKDCWGIKFHKVVGAHNRCNGLHLTRRNNNVTISECVFNGNALLTDYANIFISGSVGLENLGINILGCDFSYAGSGASGTLANSYNIVLAHCWGVNINGCYSEGGDKTTALAYIGANTQNIRVDNNYFQDGVVIFDSAKNSTFIHNTYQKVASTAPSSYLSGITDGVNGNEVYGNFNKETPTLYKGRNDGLDLQKITDAGAATNNDLTAKSLTAYDGGVRVIKIGGPHIVFEDQNNSGDIGTTPAAGETLLSDMIFSLNGAEAFRIDKHRVLQYPSDVSANYTARSLVDKNYVDTHGTGFSGTTANDIEITDATKGIILKSPNNTRWRITANNDGSLTTTSL